MSSSPATTVLSRLPEALLWWLISEWTDPRDLPDLVEHVLGEEPFRRMADAHATAPLRAGRLLPESCLAWLHARRVVVVMLETHGTPDGFHCKPCIEHEWRCNGKLHRDDDLPARIDHRGDQFWYRHGDLHRAGDRPAIVRTSGERSWYQWGQRHRVGGPARVFPNGEEFWYLRGEIHRDDDLPAHTDTVTGVRFWHRHGKLHRDGDRPAVVADDGDMEWKQHGQPHRAGGLPACVFDQGRHLEWWEDGVFVREEIEGE